MIPDISPNTRAILLLTAPLIVGRKSGNAAPLLTPTEYRKLARCLFENHRQPSDLLGNDIDGILGECGKVIDEQRMRVLLARGFQLGQALEQWHVRGIWVVSRSDPGYPTHLVARLRDQAPPVLYGCGNVELLSHRGLAVVGSRHVNDALLAYTGAVGALAAGAGRTIVSGGAKGVDQAAMFGALDAGGRVIGIMANGLENACMNRMYRDALMQGRLVLASPFDPRAGFNVGNAMARNKFIYGLSDAALVVNAEFKKGGTWSGAQEQLKRYRFVPVYVRENALDNPGLAGLLDLGAIQWPAPKDSTGFEAVFAERPASSPRGEYQRELPLERMAGFAEEQGGIAAHECPRSGTEQSGNQVGGEEGCKEHSGLVGDDGSGQPPTEASGLMKPADVLLEAVGKILVDRFDAFFNARDVAECLDVSSRQAGTWLNALADRGVLIKEKRPVRYRVCS